jgi:hypothetical protein
MRAVLDADEGEVPVQVGRGRDGHRIDAFGKQRLDAAECGTAHRRRYEVALLAVGIRDAHELDPWHVGKDAGMVAAHDAYADDADP